MKTIPVSFLVAGMLLPAVALAQPKPLPETPVKDGKEARRGQMRPFAEAWKMADSDMDGSISIQEFERMPRLRELPEEKRKELFQRLDKNGDARLSREELNRFGKPRDEHDAPMKRLWELDADKSGGISFQEFQQGAVFKKLPEERREAVFKRLDTDGDGMITPKDKPEPQSKRRDGKGWQHRPEGGKPSRGGEDSDGAPHSINRALDSDGDGTLSFEEFRTGPSIKDLPEDAQEDRFELLDRNKDLKLSPEDFKDVVPSEDSSQSMSGKR